MSIGDRDNRNWVMCYELRPGVLADVPALPAIEQSAGTRFPAGRVPSADATFPESSLRAAANAGLLFVAAQDQEQVGFAAAHIVGDRLHLDEVSVLPAHGGRGVGGRLVRAVIDAATERGLTGVSLTTFSDLPWNGPFYERLGFIALASAELDGPLREALAHERALGMTARIAMFRAGS